MNNNFLSHIIRDLFPERAFTVIYGADQGLRQTLLDPLHSVGALQLHTEKTYVEDIFEYRFWNAGLDNPHIANGCADLFVSINYDPKLNSDYTYNIAIQIKQMLKEGGKALIINPGYWARNLKNVMTIDGMTTREARRYSMLKDQDILVYENI